VRETLMNSQFTSNDLMGILPGVDFSNDTPFPTGTAKVNIATMKDGKVVRAAADVNVPVVPKW
jgi:branched-chain amino acid transport system substrate-binding protein